MSWLQDPPQARASVPASSKTRPAFPSASAQAAPQSPTAGPAPRWNRAKTPIRAGQLTFKPGPGQAAPAHPAPTRPPPRPDSTIPIGAAQQPRAAMQPTPPAPGRRSPAPQTSSARTAPATPPPVAASEMNQLRINNMTQRQLPLRTEVTGVPPCLGATIKGTTQT